MVMILTAKCHALICNIDFKSKITVCECQKEKKKCLPSTPSSGVSVYHHIWWSDIQNAVIS